MGLLRATWPEHAFTQTYLGMSARGSLQDAFLSQHSLFYLYPIVGWAKIFFLMGACKSTFTDVSKPNQREKMSLVSSRFHLLFFDLSLRLGLNSMSALHVVSTYR